MDWEAQVLRELSNDGLRITNPRRMIVAYIARAQEAFTAEQMVHDLPTVGRATIYRTLETLTANHWLARVHRDEGEHAYISSEPHKHRLVCTDCGKSVVFDTCDIDGLLTQLGKRTGFMIEGHALEAFGLCQQCQQQRSFSASSSS